MLMLKSIKSIDYFGLAKRLKSSSHVCDLKLRKQSSRYLLLNSLLNGISYYVVIRVL